ncbi:MAG: carbohydrate kinase family protein, partial [bacterium]|nr:carbohydrate kinase family protein [bacterium]
MLGAVCFDEIIPLEGEPRESFGGILYNVAAVSSLLNDGDAVVPVTRIGDDRFDTAVDTFSALPHVDTSGIGRCSDPTTHVTLTWRNETWRDETILNRMPPFDMETLSPALDCDVAHINFINGTEFDLDTLEAFREAFDGLLSLDVHQIISRFDTQGQREIVGFKQWRDWVPYVDLVQCNEYEAATMFDTALEGRADYIAAARAICEAGPRAATITLGTEGALTVSRQDDGYYLADLP